MAVNSIEQRTGRANLDTVAALRTVEPTAVSADNCINTAIARLDCILAHPFVTDTRAAFAQNASLRIIGDDRRKILFGLGVLFLSKTFLNITPVKDDLLQFTFAPAVADRAIERVICQQKFAHRTLGLFDLFTLRSDNHAVGANDRAGRLQFWHLVDANQTHTARSLNFEVLVIAKRRDPVAVFTAHIDQPRTFVHLNFLLVYGYFYLF